MGLAYVAHTPKRIAEPLIRAALAVDDAARAEHAQHPARYEQRIAATRAAGIANVRNAGESEQVSLSAIGVPIGRGTTPIAALALVYYSASMSGAEAVRRFGAGLQQLARRVSDQI
jgi:DNA-binding IclR family transcriptional regulator